MEVGLGLVGWGFVGWGDGGRQNVRDSHSRGSVADDPRPLPSCVAPWNGIDHRLNVTSKKAPYLELASCMSRGRPTLGSAGSIETKAPSYTERPRRMLIHSGEADAERNVHWEHEFLMSEAAGRRRDERRERAGCGRHDLLMSRPGFRIFAR